MVDSRAYRFAFLVRDNHEVPADFATLANPKDFETGLFLPQDHSDRFAEPKYISHLLLLGGDELNVHPHPAYKRKSARIRLADVIVVARSQFLLSASIRVLTSREQLRLPYPRREEKPVKAFLRRLAEKMLTYESPDISSPARPNTRPVAAFDKALREELLGGEDLLIQWCSSLLDSGRSDMLAITTRRLIWISKTNEMADVEEFGYRVCYAPLQQWRGLRHKAGALRVVLREAEWTIPITLPDVPYVNELIRSAEPVLEQRSPSRAYKRS